MTTKTVSLFSTFLMLTLIIFWGSSFVVVKIALNEGLTPIAIATFRFLIAGGLFLVALLLNKNRKRNYNLLFERKDAPKLLILALTGVTFFFTAQYTGIQMVSASVAAILVCLLSPILITVLSARIFKEHLTKKQILGIGIAATGTFAVITGGTISFSGSRDFLIGSLILLSTPVLWATYSLLGKKMMEKYDPFLVVAYVTMLGGLCLIPFSLAENSLHQLLTTSLHGWLAILFLSITCSLLGYYIWFYVLKRVGAAITSSFLFAEPLVTVVFAVALVGEKLNLFILAGGFLIFIGVYLVTTKQNIKKITCNSTKQL
jgi:drug/metabolite transporter (DMT)-like permease